LRTRISWIASFFGHSRRRRRLEYPEHLRESAVAALALMDLSQSRERLYQHGPRIGMFLGQPPERADGREAEVGIPDVGLIEDGEQRGHHLRGAVADGAESRCGRTPEVVVLLLIAKDPEQRGRGLGRRRPNGGESPGGQTARRPHALAIGRRSSPEYLDQGRDGRLPDRPQA